MNEEAIKRRERTFKIVRRSELAIAIILIVYGGVMAVSDFRTDVEYSRQSFGLSPLLTIVTGILVSAASSTMTPKNRWPLVMHIPLALWLCIAWLARL